MGWVLVFCQPLQTGLDSGAHLACGMLNGEITHGFSTTRKPSIEYWPTSLIPTLGAVATGAEILFGLLILAGWHTRMAARLSGGLLIVFATTMTISLGVKSVLNYAVLTGIGGSFLLANCDSFPFSLDELLSRRTHCKVTSTDVPASPVAD